MTPGQLISHYTTAELSVHVWNHDLIWWQNIMDMQKHFRKTTVTSSWTISKTKITITIVKAQMPSNPNQKSRTRDNQEGFGDCLIYMQLIFSEFRYLNYSEVWRVLEKMWFCNWPGKMTTTDAWLFWPNLLHHKRSVIVCIIMEGDLAMEK